MARLRRSYIWKCLSIKDSEGEIVGIVTHINYFRVTCIVKAGLFKSNDRKLSITEKESGDTLIFTINMEGINNELSI